MSILFDYSIEYKGLLMHTIMQEIKGICFLKLWFCEIAYPSGKYYMLPDILEIISGSKKTVLVDVLELIDPLARTKPAIPVGARW